MNLNEISSIVESNALAIVGGFHPEPNQTLLLLGPKEPDFWEEFSNSPEVLDNTPDPMDRWSKRVIDRIASEFSAQPAYPFGGPPYHPFIQWALSTGQIWQSPVQLLVHDTAGLFVSFRGALVLNEAIPLPQAKVSPCVTCAEKPCLSACPAAALNEDGYDVPACHTFLDTDSGSECLSNGCQVRRACPVGQNQRLHSQSAFHMRAFHKG